MAPAAVMARATERSKNAKLGDCSCTNAAQASCDPGCAFYDGGGCYTESDRVGMHTARLNQAAGGRRAKVDPRVIARQEAAAIDGLTGERNLRVHVVGDSRTNAAARLVSAAAERYMARGGKKAWSYTHSWRKVERASWGSVSVLASCEAGEHVVDAMARGYGAALVVAEHPADGRTWQHQAGFAVVPCPNQTREDVQCVDCRLCWDDARLRERRQVIGFAAHGAGKAKVRERLIQIAGGAA
jgi:hypothetical protein